MRILYVSENNFAISLISLLHRLIPLLGISYHLLFAGRIPISIPNPAQISTLVLSNIINFPSSLLLLYFVHIYIIAFNVHDCVFSTVPGA